jgi:hypothetical protein
MKRWRRRSMKRIKETFSFEDKLFLMKVLRVGLLREPGP